MRRLIAVPGSVDAAPVDYQLQIEANVLARTIWGEARGEGVAGMQGVGNVVMNRVRIARQKGKFWWGNDVIGVCQKPYQFSCWNKGDANFEKIQAVDGRDLVFASAMRLGFRAVIGQLADITGGATHYHAAGMMPNWARGQVPSATIGRHVFYRDIA
ncbi:MAG: cell Wall Hydrolase family protein [Micavibrio sp.]|nr:cell Wall Hydrolase family protein [Micavibrio sp.]